MATVMYEVEVFFEEGMDQGSVRICGTPVRHAVARSNSSGKSESNEKEFGLINE